MRRTPIRNAHLRARMAEEAARVMLEGGIRDFQLAKRKAAERLRVVDASQFPRNEEIERAKQDYQRLFHGEAQPRRLRHLRTVALEAMRFLEAFKPRLVGSVLDGSVDAHSEVVIHLFADPPEDVSTFLHERGVEHEPADSLVRVTSEDVLRVPAYRFFADDVGVELVVFSGRDRRRTPLSPVNGRPMQRAAIAEVAALAEGVS